MLTQTLPLLSQLLCKIGIILFFYLYYFVDVGVC